MIIFIASFIGAFLFFLLFFIGLRAVVKQRREVADRIQLFTGYQPTEVQETSFLQVLKGKIHQIFEEKAWKTGRKTNRSRWDLMMIRAGLPLLGSEFLAISGTAALVIFLLALLLTRNPVTALIVAVLFLAADLREQFFGQCRVNKGLTSMNNPDGLNEHCCLNFFQQIA